MRRSCSRIAPAIELISGQVLHDSQYLCDSAIPRAFRELVRYLESSGSIELSEGSSRGEPVVQFAAGWCGKQEACNLHHNVVHDLAQRRGFAVVSGLKNQTRKGTTGIQREEARVWRAPSVMKAAVTRGLVVFDWNEDVGDYTVISE